MKKLSIIGGCVAALGVLVFLGGFIAADFNIGRLATQPPYTEETLVLPAQTRVLDIQDKDMSVQFGPSKDGDIHITYFTNKNEFYKITQGERFSMEKQTDYKWYDRVFNISLQQTRLTVLLPADYAGEIRLQTTNGKITLQNIQAGKLQLKSTNAAFQAEEVTVQADAELITTNAPILANGFTAGGKLLCKSTNGKAMLQEVQAEDVQVITTNAAAALEQVSASHIANVKTNNGKITVDTVAAGKEIRLITTNGDIRGSITGAAKDFSMHTGTTNGENNLPEALEIGDKQLELHTTNGNIQIDFTE